MTSLDLIQQLVFHIKNEKNTTRWFNPSKKEMRRYSKFLNSVNEAKLTRKNRMKLCKRAICYRYKLLCMKNGVTPLEYSSETEFWVRTTDEYAKHIFGEELWNMLSLQYYLKVYEYLSKVYTPMYSKYEPMEICFYNLYYMGLLPRKLYEEYNALRERIEKK